MVPPEYQNHLQVCLEEAASCMPESCPYNHAIELKPSFIFCNCKPYPLFPCHKKAMNDFINENLQKGYICKSMSSMVFPLFFVNKKDGSLHSCQNYHHLNKGTVKNVYPLPLAQTLIDKLHGSTIFTKLDLCSGYNNVCIKNGDQWRAAFKCK